MPRDSHLSGVRTYASISSLTRDGNSGSMRSMKQGVTIRLRDFMEREDGWGTDEGHEVYIKMSRFVEQHPATAIYLVSLDGVKRTDASFPRESVMEVARRYRKKAGICLVDVSSEDLLDNWDAAALKKEQPIFVWLAKGYRLLGPQPSSGTADVLKLILGRFETRASDVSKDLALKIANASMKLKQLWEQGFILRREDSADTGGIEYVYFPIR
jgi:hypothetical protein